MIRIRKRTAARTPAAAAGAEPGPGFEITFDGRPVHALPGRSIAAVLWADSVLTWRTTRVNGRPRGPSAASAPASTAWSP